MPRFLILSAHWEEGPDGDGLADQVAELLRPRKAGRSVVVTMTEEQTRQRGLRSDLAAMQLGGAFDA